MKPDILVKAVNTGILPNVDKHHPFRKIMEGRHKAFATLSAWCVYNLDFPSDIVTFIGCEVQSEIKALIAGHDWYVS